MSPWAVATAVLAAALVGLGAWALVDRSSGGDSATQEATALIDDLSAATKAGDANAISALYASDAVIRSLGDTIAGAKVIGQTAANAAAAGFRVERVAPVTLDGDFATTFVKVTGVGIDETPVVAVWQLEDGKILRQWGFGIGMTEPFDNAVMP